MSVFFNDLFTEASTTALSAHTSDSGHTWAYFGFNDTHVPNIFTSFGGVVGSGAASATMWRSTGISGTSADAVVTADVRVDAVDANFTAYGLGARLNSGGTSGYLCYYNRSNGFWRLERITGSGLTLTTLADSAAISYTAGTNITVVLEVSGVGASVELALKVDGSTLITYSDTAAGRVTAIGYVGFYTQSGGNGLGWFTNSMSADDVVGGGDTTPPTVTSVSGTDTGSTSATVSASSTEAGPGWAVLTPTSTQPSQAQVEAGQDHTGSTTGVFLDTATLAIGANPAAFAFTGLTPGATYWPHVVAKDTATPTPNVSAVESGPSFTMPAPDVTAPAWPGGTTLDIVSKTDTTVTLEASADATDAVGVAGYAWSSDGGATYPFTTLTKTFTFTALTELTSYAFRCVPYDAAPNTGTHITVTTSTYRAGDTGQNIRDNTGPVGGNPAGFLYNKVTLPADADLWFSYVITSMPATGSFTTLNPDGTFVFVGPNNETMLVQLEVDGANFGAPFSVSLYDSVSQLATPSNAISTALSTRSAAIQDFNATPVNATSIGTATLSVATPPTAVSVQPVNAISIGYASRSSSRTLSLARAAKRARLPASGQTRRYLALFYKQPADFDDCDVDATDYLFAIGDTLVACEVDVEPGITIEANTVVGSTVKIWLSGGVDGRRYKVTARLITAGGRTKEVELVIRVKET